MTPEEKAIEYERRLVEQTQREIAENEAREFVAKELARLRAIEYEHKLAEHRASEIRAGAWVMLALAGLSALVGYILRDDFSREGGTNPGYGFALSFLVVLGLVATAKRVKK